MGLLQKVEFEGKDVLIMVRLTQAEYNAISSDPRELLVLPTKWHEGSLTTGRLGNGNRIMIPNKLLRSYNIDVLKKNVKHRIVDSGEKKYLVIELESRIGIPVFTGDDDETKERAEQAG